MTLLSLGQIFTQCLIITTHRQIWNMIIVPFIVHDICAIVYLSSKQGLISTFFHFILEDFKRHICIHILLVQCICKRMNMWISICTTTTGPCYKHFYRLVRCFVINSGLCPYIKTTVYHKTTYKVYENGCDNWAAACVLV
jgi:hypothetical protein